MDDLNHAAFGEALAETILQRGLGNLSKREVDVLLLHLLERHSSLSTKSNGEVAMILRAPSSRIRSLRLEAALRYSNDLAAEFRNRLSALVRSAKLVEKDSVVTMVIEDSFTKDTLLSQLKSKGSSGDWSFNAEIVRVEVDALLEVLIDLIPPEELAVARSGMGATTTLQVKKKLREGGVTLFAKLKEKAIDGVATLTADSIKDAAKQAAPQVGLTLIRLLMGI